MCEYNVITANSFGCVVQCASCQRLHVGFRSVLTAFSKGEFKGFCRKVERIAQGEAHSAPNEKIYIPTDSESFMIALNVKELNALNSLLEEAQILIEARTFIYAETGLERQ